MLKDGITFWLAIFLILTCNIRCVISGHLALIYLLWLAVKGQILN